MPAGERGGLKAAFTSFKAEADREAELKLLGRTVDEPRPTSTPDTTELASSYPVATTVPMAQSEPVGGLTPRPLLQREAVRQLSFRCPVSLAATLRRKAAFNQLEHQEIIVEGIKRVLAELADPPAGWEG